VCVRVIDGVIKMVMKLRYESYFDIFFLNLNFIAFCI